MIINRNVKIDNRTFPYRIKGSGGTLNENDIASGTYQRQKPPGEGPYTVEFGPSDFSVTIIASGIQSPDALVGITSCPKDSTAYVSYVSEPAKD